MLDTLVSAIVDVVAQLGYFGIIIMMFLESTFFPFPSEVAMIPAGYLASKGEMNLFIVLFLGTLGSLLGALFNFYLAKKYGRSIVLRFGKYFWFKEEHLQKMESFFEKHGAISTFTGRLIPGVRQYISLPAGLAKMGVKMFALFTTLGAGIWSLVLVLLGYYIGENEVLVKEYLHQIIIYTLAGLAVLISLYTLIKRKQNG